MGFFFVFVSTAVDSRELSVVAFGVDGFEMLTTDMELLGLDLGEAVLF